MNKTHRTQSTWSDIHMSIAQCLDWYNYVVVYRTPVMGNNNGDLYSIMYKTLHRYVPTFRDVCFLSWTMLDWVRLKYYIHILAQCEGWKVLEFSNGRTNTNRSVRTIRLGRPHTIAGVRWCKCSTACRLSKRCTHLLWSIVQEIDDEYSVLLFNEIVDAGIYSTTTS